MPGIAGFILTAERQDTRRTLAQMVRSMLHEPSYTSGTLVESHLGLAAAWACHDGSFSDCLPIWNEKKDIALLFVGEHYADRAEAEHLRARGHAFEPDNASYLVHLYEEIGLELFARLNGVFVGVLVDLRENKVVVFNDRYGLGRIYYHEGAEGFWFATEAKAILGVFPQLRQLDPQGLGEFFACGSVLQNRTLFPGISLLPPAAAWTFRPGRQARKETYFNCQTWEDQPRLSESDYYDKLKATFDRILPRHLNGTERIAMSVTGGLDSRIIMAWARRQPSTLPCYSHRGVFRECADARIGRRVAQACQQPHRTITVNGKFFSDFPSLAAQTVWITDGAMDVSGAAGLYVNRIARQELATIRMTGNYGGEILRGMIALAPAKLQNPFFDQDFEARVQEGLATLRSEQRGNRTSFIAFKQVPWHHYARYALEQSQLTIRSPYLDNDLVALAYQAPAEFEANQRLALRLIADGNPALACFPTDRGPMGRIGPLGKIRERYQELTFKTDYAYDYGMPHWLTKVDRALRALHLERLFLGRHKYYHFRLWYRNQLSQYVTQILLDPVALSRPYLNRRRVERIVTAHVSGTGNYTSEIHGLLTAELIHRQLIDGPRIRSSSNEELAMSRLNLGVAGTPV